MMVVEDISYEKYILTCNRFCSALRTIILKFLFYKVF
jgi:hypothetical protein